ncbi:MAG: UDP-N-acetylmuramoyl-L-alanyl-D-glutamate--2,6-diaminopimelate ligase [Anaerolineae bacterium]|nr:UDP-N-acetylmuramoyl-L-alanyl-D-glutamate--2,6-diaminopimelate ligase [Anaerolineae bacterium]
MQLVQLVRALSSYTLSHLDSMPAQLSDFAALDITRVTDKSQHVIPGSLFVAYPGLNVDGAQFIPDALQRGAVAIVSQSPFSILRSPFSELQSPGSGLRSPVPVFRVSNGRSALAHLSAAYYGYPSRNLRVIGVTGTDGKTTTSTLIENILLAAGHTVGTITTVAAHIGGQQVDTGFHTTTPDAPDIQSYLARMVERGAEYAVVESTSHGLDQRRLDAIDFDIAVVTNITHEHLDIHGTWENYRDAKAQLFRFLSSTARKPRTPKVAVLNADDNTRGVLDYLAALPCDERIIYTALPIENQEQKIKNAVRLAAHSITHTPSGLKFTISTPFGDLPIESPLIGRYNVSNILAAVGAAVGRRIPFDAIAQGVRITHGIAGRMERIPGEHPFTVIVDFAHTPFALENALKTARELVSGADEPANVGRGGASARGRVIAVFGCAGLRDVQKRAWMGEISGTLADLTVVTAEDPRTESLSAINALIQKGLHKVGRVQDQDYFIVDDRGSAIEFALNRLARPGDVIMICGKGHELSMCFGTTEYPWSDQDAARKALASPPFTPS